MLFSAVLTISEFITSVRAGLATVFRWSVLWKTHAPVIVCEADGSKESPPPPDDAPRKAPLKLNGVNTYCVDESTFTVVYEEIAMKIYCPAVLVVSNKTASGVSSGLSLP